MDSPEYEENFKVDVRGGTAIALPEPSLLYVAHQVYPNANSD